MTLDMVSLASPPASGVKETVCRAHRFAYWWQTQESAQGRVPKGKNNSCFILTNTCSSKPKGGQKCALPGEAI